MKNISCFYHIIDFYSLGNSSTASPTLLKSISPMLTKVIFWIIISSQKGEKEKSLRHEQFPITLKNQRLIKKDSKHDINQRMEESSGQGNTNGSEDGKKSKVSKIIFILNRVKRLKSRNQKDTKKNLTPNMSRDMSMEASANRINLKEQLRNLVCLENKDTLPKKITFWLLITPLVLLVICHNLKIYSQD